MKREFKTLNGKVIENVVDYIKDKIQDRNNVSVYVGSDSQNVGQTTVYACVIVLHYNKRGGHVLYTKFEVDKIKDRFSKLWKEVEVSMEVATFLKENEIETDFVDIDLNPDPYYGSNMVFRSAMGFVESFGFTPRMKPFAIAASYCADKFCKIKKKKRKKIKHAA